MSKESEIWCGNERRTNPYCGGCLDHSGLVERVKSNESEVSGLKNSNFVPFSNYKWSFGILSSILISLFSIAIYLALETNSEVNKISAKQETTYYKITVMQKDINDLKEDTAEDIEEIKKQLNRNHP